MSRFRSMPSRTTLALGLLLLGAASFACDEDGKSAPDKCGDPALQIYDIQTAGEPADDNARFPCVTEIGHAVSSISTATPVETAGTGGTAGKSSAGGSGGKGGNAGTGGK
jgi:hypothetical protein